MHDCCVFDYFLLNFFTISACELHKVMIVVCLTIFSSILSPFQYVSYIKCMIIVCLTIFFSIFSQFQDVSYIKYMILVYLTIFLFNSFTISVSELRKVHDCCVFN